MCIRDRFHDVLPGSGIPYAYMDTYNDQELAERLMENTLNSGVNSMAYVADTQVAVSYTHLDVYKRQAL